jgi:hypothetical protein
VSHDDLKKSEAGKEEFDELREKLRRAMPAIGEAELRRDLWPDMLRRLERPQIRVPWFDWALLGVAAAAAIFFPALIPAVLYHL